MSQSCKLDYFRLLYSPSTIIAFDCVRYGRNLPSHFFPEDIRVFRRCRLCPCHLACQCLRKSYVEISVPLPKVAERGRPFCCYMVSANLIIECRFSLDISQERSLPKGFALPGLEWGTQSSERPQLRLSSTHKMSQVRSCTLLRSRSTGLSILSFDDIISQE